MAVPTEPIEQSAQQPRPKKQWSSNPQDFAEAPQQPRQPAPQRPAQQPRSKKQWSSNPQDFAEAPQQPRQPAPQRPVQQPRPKKQWSSDPQDFAEAPQQPRQPAPQRPVQQPRPKKQWSSDPQNFAEAPQQPRQSAPQRRSPASRNGGRSQQPNGKIELNPIVQERQDLGPTGERLENLPPQQSVSDPNFDTDSYVKNLHRQIKADQSTVSRQENTVDVVKKAESVEVQPMKFDGKQLRAASVNVVKAPNKSNTMILPIIIVVVLVIALIVIAVVMLSGNKDGEGTAQTSDTTASASSTVSEVSSESSTTVSAVGFSLDRASGWDNTLSDYDTVVAGHMNDFVTATIY